MTDQIENKITLPSRMELVKTKESEHYVMCTVTRSLGPVGLTVSEFFDDFEYMRSLGFKVIYHHGGQFICEKVTP